MIRVLFLMVIVASVAISTGNNQVNGCPVLFQQEGDDGDDGTAGTDGDPATDGTDGGQGGEGLFIGGAGGRGGVGGNGVDGDDADSDAQGGNGGTGGRGGNTFAQIEREFNKTSLDFSRSAWAGRGGDAGSAGTSSGVFDLLHAGNGGDGGDATLHSNVLNTDGDATSTMRVFGGNGGSVGGNSLTSQGNGGDGGHAIGSSALSVSGATTTNSTTLDLIGGNGGSAIGPNGIGGNGGKTTGSASIFSDSSFASAVVNARAGHGGAIIGSQRSAGSGGNSILENAVSGGAQGTIALTQETSGGNGGNAVNGGRGGFGGNASSLFSSSDVNQTGDHALVRLSAQGGWGGTGVTRGGSGGSAYAEANVFDRGDLNVLVEVNGGAGAASSSGFAGKGGAASLGQVYGNSANGDATVRAFVEGGQGGAGSDLARAGNGFSVILNNSVDGDAKNSLTLVQLSEGGNSGGQSGLRGIAGSAVSVLETEKSVRNLLISTTARGGSGGLGRSAEVRDGNGGAAFTRALSRNLTGNVESEATSESGRGDFGGLSRSVSRAIAVQDGRSADARSVAMSVSNVSDSTRGGDAVGIGVAIHEGSGRANATAISTAGDGQFGGDAQASSKSIVRGAGVATARATATAGEGRGTANGTTFARSMTDANSILITQSGDGNHGTGSTDACSGRHISLMNSATGAAGQLLTINHGSWAGKGGHSEGGLAGKGGSSFLDYHSENINSMGGETVLKLRAGGGSGGENNGDGDGGDGGKGRLVVNAISQQGINLEGGSRGSSVGGGAGGRALGDGQGGRGGGSFGSVNLTSLEGNSAVDLVLHAGNGGNTIGSGQAGNGGVARADVNAISHGGWVDASNRSVGGAGGRSFGAGAAGDGGNAYSRVNAQTFGANATSQSGAFAGFGGMNTGSGNDGLARAWSAATTSQSGTALSEATARGRSGFAISEAITAGSSYNEILVRARANIAGEVSSAAQAKIGSQFLSNNVLDGIQAGSWISADPGEERVGSFVAGNESILEQFELGQNAGKDLSDVFLVGGIVGGYSASDSETAVTNVIDVKFEIDVSGMNDQDLVLGFFGPQSNFDGFDELFISFQADGFSRVTREFSELSEANNFFSDNTFNLGELSNTETLSGRLLVNYTSNDANRFMQFNWLLGNAGGQQFSLSAVPEPSGAMVIICLMSIALKRRKRI